MNLMRLRNFRKIDKIISFFRFSNCGACLSKMDEEIWIAVRIFLFGIIALLATSLFLGLYGSSGFTNNILVEAHGILIDVFVISIIMNYFLKKAERRRLLRRYKDEIDEVRYWESPEASFKIRSKILSLTKEGIHNVDLHECYLAGIDLHHADLHGADLTRADLTNSKLSGANLQGALLIKATLIGTNLYRADLTGAVLNDTELDTANLMDSKLINANICGARLAGAMLDGAILEGSIYDRRTTFPTELSDLQKRESLGMFFVNN